MALLVRFSLLALVAVAQIAIAHGAKPIKPAEVSAAKMASSPQRNYGHQRHNLPRADKPLTHIISVGTAGAHVFEPQVTLALVGDTIEFDFYPVNHSVVRAEYGSPCVPYELTGVNKIGFFSGFKPVEAVLEDPPKYSIRVNDTEPIFFYCSAPGSCIDYGMVGAINPNASTSVARQEQKAKEADYMLQPGEEFPAEASSSLSSVFVSPTSLVLSSQTGSIVSTSTSLIVPSPFRPVKSTSDSDSGGSGLSGGAIAGIVIGAVVFVLILVALFFYIGRSRTLQRSIDRNSATITAAPSRGPDMYPGGQGMHSPSPHGDLRHSGMTSIGHAGPWNVSSQYPKSTVPGYEDQESFLSSSPRMPFADTGVANAGSQSPPTSMPSPPSPPGSPRFLTKHPATPVELPAGPK